MNSLEHHLRENHLNEIESMNALQDAGIISDLCVFACDVAEADCMVAISFLTFAKIAPKPKYEKQAEMPFARQPYPD